MFNAVGLVAVLIMVTGMVGCITPGVATRPAEFSETVVAQPGEVLVDHGARRAELGSADADLCPIEESRLPTSAIEPIVELRTTGEWDERFTSPRNDMVELGAACLKSGGAPCRMIVDTMLTWARAEAAIVRSCCDTERFWVDSLVVNLEVARPFIGAYAIARASVPVTSDDDMTVQRWMERVVTKAEHLMRGLYRKGRNYAAHNHAIGSAAAHMAYGAMWGDEEAFGHGIDQWFITLGDMRDDGSFPIEARRGDLALFYTGRTLSGLMSIAEMARTQGIDLYAANPAEGKTIHQAVSFMIAAIERNELIYAYAKEDFWPRKRNNWKRQHLGSLGSTLGWAVPYAARFPDHPNTLWMQSLRTDLDSDQGPAFGTVLREGARVMGHWPGARADCLYRAL